MKKFIWVSFVLTLISGLFLGSWSQTLLAADQDKYGGILKIGSSHPAVTFGYPPTIRGADLDYGQLCLQRLFRLDDRGNLEPQLATKWELSPDEKNYTLYLRKGVKFHDGTEFNAAAVKWNLNELEKVKSLSVLQIASVDVVDDYTIQLKLHSWDNLILTQLAADGNTLLVSPTGAEKNGVEWAQGHPVGTGPFYVRDEVKRTLPVKYVKFDDYWEKGLPYLDGITVTHIPDPMARLISLKAGDIDVLIDIDLKDAADLKAKGEYEIRESLTVSFNLFVNTKDSNSIFADKRIRQALELALNKEQIASSLGYGFIRASYEAIPRVYDCPGKVLRKFNPDMARKLLAEAGYTDGLKTAIHVEPKPMHKDFATAMQGYLADVGIGLDVQVTDFPLMRSLTIEGGLGNTIIAAPYRSPVGSLYAAAMNLPSESPMTAHDMARTPGLERLLEQAKKEKDPDKIKDTLMQMEKLAYDDAMFIPFLGVSEVGAINKSVRDHGLFHPVGGIFYDMSRAWLSKK